MTVGWLDCSAGVSGDMLLGALTDIGCLDDLPAIVAAVPELTATVTSSRTDRAGVAAVKVDVLAGTDQPPRRRSDVQALVGALPLPEEVRVAAGRVFDHLAAAEATVHGTSPDDVHFHEVGAVDAVVDVVGSCLGLHRLGLAGLVVSPIALGGGRVRGAHGDLPVPGPAVLELLAGSAFTAVGGPDEVERATPTGVALVTALGTATGPMPAMRVTATGVGAGARDSTDRPNVVRLVVGEPVDQTELAESWLQLDANVDDLDPRLWPGVIEALLAAGAADAWVTPILMKKGRPAHTLSALVPASAAEAVRATMFRESSTLGVRFVRVGKHALDRDWATVVVDAVPEWQDVAAAAAALGRPAKAVLAAAVAAAGAVAG
jgi:uncharacterized protein (TIGR00299 family) protein